MTSNRIKISDKFDQSTCGVCGDCEINQYFSINDNFIDYNGTFYSLREILSSALDFQINHDESTMTEVCLDCKDKVVKFYHFKRKAKEIQKLKLQSSRLRGPKKEKQSKVVHNIVEIVENYTEKCAISSIRIDEGSKKLIIEPQEGGSVSPTRTAVPIARVVVVPQKQEPLPFEPEYIEEGSLNAVTIKQEPGLMIEENSYNEDDSMTFNEGDEPDDDDKDYSGGESFQQYYGGGDSSEPGTSTSTRRRSSQARSRSRNEPSEEIEAEKLKEKRRRRMELLKLPNNHDLYERHKAQARERTRRYRAKMRQQKLVTEGKKRGTAGAVQSNPQARSQASVPQASVENKSFDSKSFTEDSKNFQFYQFPHVKVEDMSGDDDIIFT